MKGRPAKSIHPNLLHLLPTPTPKVNPFARIKLKTMTTMMMQLNGRRLKKIFYQMGITFEVTGSERENGRERIRRLPGNCPSFDTFRTQGPSVSHIVTPCCLLSNDRWWPELPPTKPRVYRKRKKKNEGEKEGRKRKFLRKKKIMIMMWKKPRGPSDPLSLSQVY